MWTEFLTWNRNRRGDYPLIDCNGNRILINLKEETVCTVMDRVAWA